MSRKTKTLAVTATLLCAGLGPAAADRIDEVAAAHGLDPEEIRRPLHLTEEMKDWGRGRVPSLGTEQTRLKELLEAFHYSDSIDFVYEAGYTGTAEEVFATGKFNCLSFTTLFVAMARELGLPAYYLNVEGIHEYTTTGDLVILSRHVTAGYGPMNQRTILELQLGPQINYKTAHQVSDPVGLALFYSNRGAELLRSGEMSAAVEQLELAVDLAPKLAQTWVNLGVARRRSGDATGAEEAYLKAIELEKNNLPALHDLAALLRMKGEDDAAGELLSLLEELGSRNPVTLLLLGDSNLQAGRLEEAERFYRRALKMARFEATTHAAMGLWALAGGNLGKARNWLASARSLDSGNERVRQLAERLAAAGGG